MCKVIAIAYQKGGVGKTTTTSNLGIGLARIGKKVLLIDMDVQGSLTASMGYREPDELETSLANILDLLMNDENIEIQKGMLTINAFACSDSILIPVQAAYLPIKGLQQLMRTIEKVKRQINPKLQIEGILLTMVDERTNHARDLMYVLRQAYEGKMRVFATYIPRSVRAEETSAKGMSIYRYDPNGKVASAYNALTLEVFANE